MIMWTIEKISQACPSNSCPVLSKIIGIGKIISLMSHIESFGIARIYGYVAYFALGIIDVI